MEKLLNSAQLAEYLNVKTVTVQRKAARGEIPSVRIGKRFRFDKQRIDRWLQQNANGEQANILVSGDRPIKGVTGELEDEDEIKTQTELIKELQQLREQVSKLEKSEQDFKQAEDALKQSEHNLRTYLENAPDGVYINDLKGNFLYGNRKAEEILGYKKEELLGKNMLKLNLIPANQLPGVSKLLARSVMGKSTGSDELELSRKDGSRVWVEINTVSITQQKGKVVVGFVRDITERNKAAEALWSSEERLRRFMDSATDAFSIYDSEFNLIECNQTRMKMYFPGLKKEDVIGKNILELLPHVNGTDRYARMQKVIETGKPFSDNNTISYFDDPSVPESERRHISFKAFKVGDGLGVVSTDITERKKAEEALRNSEERMRLFMDSATDAFSIWDSELNLVDCNEVRMKMLFPGLGKKKVIGKNIQELFPHFGGTDRYKQYLEVMKTGKPLFVADAVFTEDSFTRPESEQRHMTVRAFKVGDGLGVINTDITERKKAEEALTAEAIRRRIFIEQSRDGIVVLGQDGGVYETNQRFAEMIGFSPEEVSQLHVWDWEFQFTREQVLDMLRNVDESGDFFKTQHRRKDGTIYNVEISTNAAVFAGEKLIFCVCRDITERIRADEQIRASLAEKELLLKEVYHRVKNNMQVVSSLLNLQSKMAKDEETRELFRESQNRIKSMELVHNKLYQSANMASINFREYIKELASELLKSYRGSAGRIATKMEGDGVSLGIDQAIPCGMVVNELFSNALKYAFPDNAKGEITFSISETTAGAVQLIIADNGVGIPESLDLRNLKSLGLYLVTTVVEQQLNGKLELDRSAGTKYSISFMKK